MNQILGLSFANTQYQRPTVSVGQQPQSMDSVGSSEPGGLSRRPQFAASSETSEGQRRSIGSGRNLAIAFALMIIGGALGGCATVHRPEPPAPVAMTAADTSAPAAKQAGQAIRDWHENVDKPVANAAVKGVKDWHEKVDKPVKEKAVGVGHWFRDRAKEFKDGVTGK